LQSAQAIFAAAQEKLGAQNQFVRDNPRMNNYYRRDQAPKGLADPYPSLQIDPQLAAAAKMLTEADPDNRNGTMSRRSYELPAGFKPPPGYESAKLRKRDTSFWMETLGPQFAGSYPLDPSEGAGYKVWRNVKDYGATGLGTADDTDAINKAMADGNRCGKGCNATSAKGAVIYFPPGKAQSQTLQMQELINSLGTYLVSSPIISFYNTQMIGNAANPPTIKASKFFSGLG
jgi:Pectate lyase superfamily protein